MVSIDQITLKFLLKGLQIYWPERKNVNYKHSNTMQVLIGITPRVHSALFLSHGDKFLTDICGILKLLKPRDLLIW